MAFFLLFLSCALQKQGLASAKIGHTPGSIGRNSAFVVREDAKNIGEILCREKSLRDPPGEKFSRNVYLVGLPDFVFSISPAPCPSNDIPQFSVTGPPALELMDDPSIGEIVSKNLVEEDDCFGFSVK